MIKLWGKLSGYRTRIGAAALILTGISNVLGVISGDGGDITEGLGMIAAGITAMGIYDSDKFGG